MREESPSGRRRTIQNTLPRAAAVFILAICAIATASPAGAITLPAGFTDEQVTPLGSPTALAFTPDGRLLITTQPGQLRVYQNGALVPTAALNLASPTNVICSNSERGLLGVAVDPSFATPNNNFIYVYYTFNRAGTCVNRVSRYVLSPSNVASGETVLIDNIPSTAGNHNAGDVQFGRDGYLYVSVGDGGCDYVPGGGCAGANDASRDQHSLVGKILRITRDGNIPTDNPFTGAGTADCRFTGGTTAGNKCRETFAWGFRNPFRIAFDPNDGGTRFFSNDVGQNYVIVDTGPWIFGKKVMLPAGVIKDVDLDTETVFVNRTRDQIKSAPEFDEDRYRDDAYRGDVGSYYGPGGAGYRENDL